MSGLSPFIIAESVTPKVTSVQVDKSNPIRRWSPTKSRPTLHRTYYRAICPKCEGEWEVRADDADRRSSCPRCQRVAAGISCAIKQQMMTPSEAETLVWLMIAELNVGYVRQYHFEAGSFNYVIDFVIGNKAVEVVGYWHERKKCEKDYRLRALWPGQIIFISADEIQHAPDAVRRALRMFLGGESTEDDERVRQIELLYLRYGAFTHNIQDYWHGTRKVVARA